MQIECLHVCEQVEEWYQFMSFQALKHCKHPDDKVAEITQTYMPITHSNFIVIPVWLGKFRYWSKMEIYYLRTELSSIVSTIFDILHQDHSYLHTNLDCLTEIEMNGWEARSDLSSRGRQLDKICPNRLNRKEG